MSGQWPPEWEDADDGNSDAELPDGSAVTSFLAEVGSPALPAAFEARISAAIAAEAAARVSVPQAAATQVAQAAATQAADDPATSASRRLRRGSRTSASTGGGSGPRGSRPDGRRRRLRMPSAQASGWVALCCLVIGGFGFLITHTSSSSSSSSAPYSAAAGAPVAPAASSAAGASESHAAAGLAPNNSDQQSEPSASTSAPTDVLFTETGTRYQQSTLASQVQDTMAKAGLSYPALSPMPVQSAAASSSSTDGAGSGGASAQKASPQLEGCVWQLTGGVTPSLVDKASYDGKPAYIIAVPSQVWVVGLGCTAAHTDVIARVPLKG